MDSKTETVTIPEEIINICREFAELARKHDLRTCGIKFGPPFKSWGGDISMSWEQGRHGEDSNDITIHSSFFVSTKVNSQSPDTIKSKAGFSNNTK